MKHVNNKAGAQSNPDPANEITESLKCVNLQDMVPCPSPETQSALSEAYKLFPEVEQFAAESCVSQTGTDDACHNYDTASAGSKNMVVGDFSSRICSSQPAERLTRDRTAK